MKSEASKKFLHRISFKEAIKKFTLRESEDYNNYLATFNRSKQKIKIDEPQELIPKYNEKYTSLVEFNV